MTNISKLRDTADFLLESGKYEDAFVVYDEISKQVWCALGTIQSGLSEFSQDYLNHNIRTAIQFRKTFYQAAANTIFVKWFNLDFDQTLNEFVFSLNGHLKCLINSPQLLNKYNPLQIYTEYLVLYNLVLNTADESWVHTVTKIISPQIDSNRLKSVRPILPESTIKRMLIESAIKIKETDWAYLNNDIVSYMLKVGENFTDIFRKMRDIAGPFSYQKGQQQSRRKKESYRKYEKYERYEKYEKYEEYDQGSSKAGSESKDSFSAKNSSDAEKSRYYGKILGLQGKVTKGQIRKKYLEMMSLYHPDKVENLGRELIELADKKTKEINEAYEWLRVKFNI